MTELSIDGVDLSHTGLALPPRAYTSRAIYEAELTGIFEHSWVHVADLAELQQAGDFVTASIGRVPVISVRGHDDQVRCFLNACRHRGATLAEGQGNCGRQLKCPYHAWAFATDGELVGVPHKDEFPRLDELDLNLVPIRAATMGPLVFACLDAGAPELRDWAGNLYSRLQSRDDLRPAFEYEYEVPVNWKVYMENGLEGYHLDFVHDVLNDLVGQRDAVHHLEEHSSYTLAPINPDFKAMFAPVAPPHADIDNVRFGLMFPNMVPVISPADFLYLRIDPLGPERIRLRARSFDSGSLPPELTAFRAESVNRTNEQDIAVVQRVQRGLAAHARPPGIHSNHLERRIDHFQDLVRGMLGAHQARALVSLRQAG